MTSIISGILQIFNFVISVLLAPIDYLLGTLIPNFDTFSSNISGFFNYFYNTFLFFLNWIHIPSSVYTLIIGYITFRVSIFIGTLGYKLFIHWFKVVKGN